MISKKLFLLQIWSFYAEIKFWSKLEKFSLILGLILGQKLHIEVENSKSYVRFADNFQKVISDANLKSLS